MILTADLSYLNRMPEEEMDITKDKGDKDPK